MKHNLSIEANGVYEKGENEKGINDSSNVDFGTSIGYHSYIV
jgi:hypothetical protein